MRLGIHRREFGCDWLQNTPPYPDMAEPHHLADGVGLAPGLRDAILSMPRDDALRRHYLRERWTISRQEARKPSSGVPRVFAQPVLPAVAASDPHAIERGHRQSLPEPATAESPPAGRKDASHRARPGRAQ